jgi:hypothetical protein
MAIGLDWQACAVCAEGKLFPPGQFGSKYPPGDLE